MKPTAAKVSGEKARTKSSCLRGGAKQGTRIPIEPADKNNLDYDFLLRPHGLINLSNSCYMNAIIQSLHATTLFKETVFKILRNDTKWRGNKTNVLNEIARLFRKQLITIIKPDELFKAICSINSCSSYAAGGQQDCCELLQNMLDHWSEASKEIVRLFEGGYRSVITCSECNHVADT